ncbi:MAG: LrgB family protein [Oryzomonas sp.]|nr:LrgB family protein [Oryzomonas sp.]MDR3580938.1 LrgB family protein [Oryzomonas sp.]
MNFLGSLWNNRAAFAVLESMILWSAVTIAFYLFAKRFYRRWPRWWTAPLVVTPLLLIVVTITSHTSYSVYINGTHWLITLLGPATVAFAVPIYKQRHVIRRHWLILAIGVLVGSGTAMVSAWGLATMLGLEGSLRLSLLPRSISTPFAMTVSGEIGGVPELTAVFVILTGVFGATFGESMLYWMPLRSALARGSLFGMGAHAVGSNKAHQINRDEGAIAGLVMVLAGVFNVLAAPLLAHFLR